MYSPSILITLTDLEKKNLREISKQNQARLLVNRFILIKQFTKCFVQNISGDFPLPFV